MTLSEIKKALQSLETISFVLPNGNLVPEHFHVTEVGKVTKNFIDCGGTLRKEEVISFQLWEANDYNHRLHPEKLVHIIDLAEKQLQLPDVTIEVEYQMAETIGKFQLDFDGTQFLLVGTLTDCLAKDNCGISTEKPKVKIGEWKAKEATSCAPNSRCC